MQRQEVYREAGIRLALARERAGFTQTALADRLGIHRVTWNGYETGNRPIPFDVAVDVAAILGCSVDYLAGRETPPELVGVLNHYRSLRFITAPTATPELVAVAN